MPHSHFGNHLHENMYGCHLIIAILYVMLKLKDSFTGIVSDFSPSFMLEGFILKSKMQSLSDDNR